MNTLKPRKQKFFAGLRCLWIVCTSSLFSERRPRIRNSGIRLCFIVPLFLISCSFLLPLFLLGCSKHQPEQPGPASEEKSAESESRVQHGTNGEVIIKLEPATQKLMGLQITSPQPAQLAPEIKGYGRVIDVSPLLSLLAEISAAQAASAASQAELTRLKALIAESNASQRALQAAEAAAARDQSQVESARLRLLANWGRAISERKDLPLLAQSLGSLSSALVQVELPAGQPVPVLPTGARLFSLADPTSPVPADFIGPAPTVDPQNQGRGFLFFVPTNSSGLASGAIVTALVILPGEPQSGVTLPRSAIIRHNGGTWVYLQTGPEMFERVEVKLTSPLAHGWFVSERPKAQDKIVTVGAQQLLSEELKGQASE